MLPINSISLKLSEKSSWLLINIVSTATSSERLIMIEYSSISLQEGKITYSSLLELRIDFGFLTPFDEYIMVAPLSLEAKFFRFLSSWILSSSS